MTYISSFDQSPFWQAATGLPKGIYAGQTYAYPQNLDQAQYPEQTQPFGALNFGLHVGDEINLVQQRRANLLSQLSSFGATRLQWLDQTHSTHVYRIDQHPVLMLNEGDGLVTYQRGVALMMMTADCLPIVVTDADGEEVACLHAGWRGLANGIIEATIASMQNLPSYAWIGTAISQQNFEVGAEVKTTFLALDADFAQHFIPHTQAQDKYFADLTGLARAKLRALGIEHITAAEQCSYADPAKFYSYRRQAKTGRMATFVFRQ